MKPTIGKYKNAKGKITAYHASIGPLQTQGDTPGEAADRCTVAVVDALRRLELGTTIGSWQGHMYVIAPSINGFSYWIDTFSRPDYFTDTNGSREFAADHALLHLAQTLWSCEVPDDRAYVASLPAGIQSELLGYFHWQREYRRLSTKGYNDTDTRAIIGGFKREADPVTI